MVYTLTNRKSLTSRQRVVLLTNGDIRRSRLRQIRVRLLLRVHRDRVVDRRHRTAYMSTIFTKLARFDNYSAYIDLTSIILITIVTKFLIIGKYSDQTTQPGEA